ncbi:MAG: DUF4241 domain-containing protein [Chloroflexi bacterium]|nr:MAG: DUF4241 domain-containing protein [Chloroflexota bacterium]
MSSARPVISDRAGVAIAALAILTALAGALLLGHTKAMPHADLSKHAQTAAAQGGVQLTTALSLRQTAPQVIDVVADVSILNGDSAVAYIGINCLNPVSVDYRSTRPDPAGPPYSASATALRDRIMRYRHSLDESLTFSSQPPDKIASASPTCDQSGPPILAPHQHLVFRLSSPLLVGGTPYVDTQTTDVVSVLELGDPPLPGAPPAPIKSTKTIELRTPVQQLASYSLASRAELEATSLRFESLMNKPDLAAWVYTQDPSSWGEARLTDSFKGDSKWTLTAFNRGFALPVVVTGVANKAASVQIPTERAAQPGTMDAAIPAGASERRTGYVEYKDLYVGDLVLPSGKVMVGDPVSSDSMLTFNLGLKAGRYPVRVVTARPPYMGDDYVRAAWEAVTLSDSPVTHWVPAVPVGHNAKELKPGQAFQWGTDGGEGGFASPEAMERMDASIVGDMALYDSLGNREEANRWLWAFLTVDSASGANVFACQSGFGDGGYPVFLGLDAGNNPAVLLSDFAVLDLTFGGR